MNTIVILMDTLRRDHLGCYGDSPVKTPNIDRFAADATVFENSYISSYPCMPARQDLFTGQLSFLRRGWSPLEYDQPDLVTLLSGGGARTALVTDHYHYWQYGAGNYHQSFNACELIRGQENDNYRTGDEAETEYPAAPEKLNDRWHRYWRNTQGRGGDDDYFTAQVFSKSMDWVRNNADSCGERGFFLMIDCFDPHEPFDPPLAFAEPYLPEGWRELPIWPRYGESGNYTQQELEIIHGLYCGEIAFLDHWFGKFYEMLEEKNLLDDTAVILTSDHGWLFGEHRWLGKHSHLLYDEIVHTPLIVHHPALEKLGKKRSEALVQMADLMPTILDIMGTGVPESVRSCSLAGLWDESKPQEATSREAIIFGVFGGEVYCTDGGYVLAKRPNETNSPLYWYTRSHFNNWDFGQVNYWRDSIKRIDQYDGTRFPVQYENAWPRHAAPQYVDAENLAAIVRKRDALFDIAHDPHQTRDLAEERPDLVLKYRAEMKRLMQRYDAPEEQYERLDLE